MRTILTFLMLLCSVLPGVAKQPNLVIVMTDEHNFRTLGFFRALLPEDQAFVWGKGVKVDTPHIDSLAAAGAICTSFYVSSPVCSPSRASFMTGMYPHKTGVPTNDLPMYDHMVTFAEILGRNGYATGYVGKWHLDGDGKPQWAPERKFGWQDNRYMFNRGHYKNLTETQAGPAVNAPVKKDGIPGYDLGDADEKSFTTDFLMDRTLDFIREHKDQPFCVMLSIPDPHGPNTVRKPYDTRFTHLEFQKPGTFSKTKEQTPKWSTIGGNNYYEEDHLNQRGMATYFGMVQCIDDNMGRLLSELSKLGLEEDTIVVFTSDHGDLMGEHRRDNKGVPFEASAKVAFVLKQPGKVKSGTVIESALTSVDFGPTILSLMGIKEKLPDAQGQDLSGRFLSNRAKVSGEEITYFRGTTDHPAWVAAASHRYKLVISDKDSPWLFDLEKDPGELVNYYNDGAYRDIREHFTNELKRLMVNAEDPALKIKGYTRWL